MSPRGAIEDGVGELDGRVDDLDDAFGGFVLEHRIGIEYLVAATELIIDVRGSNPELNDLIIRARRALDRGSDG